MSRADPQVNFRMPAALKQKLKMAAAENRRSITAELVARLDESFAREQSPSSHSLTFAISKEQLMQGPSSPDAPHWQDDSVIQALQNAQRLAMTAHIKQLTASIIAEVMAGTVLSERGFSVDITDSMKAKLEMLANAKGTAALNEYAEIMEQVANIIDERQALASSNAAGTDQKAD